MRIFLNTSYVRYGQATKNTAWSAKESNDVNTKCDDGITNGPRRSLFSVGFGKTLQHNRWSDDDRLSHRVTKHRSTAHTHLEHTHDLLVSSKWLRIRSM